MNCQIIGVNKIMFDITIEKSYFEYDYKYILIIYITLIYIKILYFGIKNMESLI